ncbi:MAG: hypothetical protein OWS74_01695, partial [Firmicutes bacterium]|nr:hypothetical protein [Bacillota bacterium]
LIDLGDTPVAVIEPTVTQRLIASAYFGRISALQTLFMQLSMFSATLLAGYAARYWGVTETFAALGIFLTGFVIFLWHTPLRAMGRMQQYAEPAKNGE